MKIGIEAQRIFRKNKHGMDYVVLQEIKELQQMQTGDEYYVFVKPGEDRCVEDSANESCCIVPAIQHPSGATFPWCSLFMTLSSWSLATKATSHFIRIWAGSIAVW